ncbi:MAG: response regulator [Pseudidiomarina sp.]|nr:response regulator [Pseudidiomarina sp.]MDX1705108.1 response regulator [Pseudidiomarina sp.]
MNNDFLFADEQEAQLTMPAATSGERWKVLIVDDEKEVHAVTRLALMELTFEGRGLDFLSAYSRQEAEQLVMEHNDLALVLLDVVMDTDDAGLKVAKFIREQAQNQHARIILRTGQPGQAPERYVVINYDINDYKAKTELTSQKLFTCVMSALRSYRDIIRVDAARKAAEHKLQQVFEQLEQNHPEIYQRIKSTLGKDE